MVQTRPIKRQFFVPYNGKIADITHADTNLHTLDLATALSETRKIIALLPYVGNRVGTGELVLYPNEGASGRSCGPWTWPAMIVIANGTQRLQYKLTVANDDWDLYCVGYVVEA